jgi:hypothetical protein
MRKMAVVNNGSDRLIAHKIEEINFWLFTTGVCVFFSEQACDTMGLPRGLYCKARWGENPEVSCASSFSFDLVNLTATGNEIIYCVIYKNGRKYSFIQQEYEEYSDFEQTQWSFLDPSMLCHFYEGEIKTLKVFVIFVDLNPQSFYINFISYKLFL